MVASRRAASSASRASACASRAHLGEPRALAFDLAAHGGKLVSTSVGGGRAATRFSASLRAGGGLVAVCGQPRLRLAERREPRGVAAGFALGRGMPVARRVGLVLALAPARARLRFGLGGGGDLGFGRLDRARLASTSPRTACSSASMSASRFLPASRRAAPVGALAATEKPSQRQRSPSRETSRWPGLSSGQARGVGALDHADLRQPRAPVPSAP